MYLEFFSFYRRKNSELFILDEAGFGTKPLRRYGYSKIGTPAILQKKLLKFISIPIVIKEIKKIA